MNVFLITLFATAVLLITAIPGYVLIKRKILTLSSIQDFSKLLVYISSPCLVVYTFSKLEFSWEKLIDLGICALLCIAIHAIMLTGAYLILKKKCENPMYRIVVIASAIGNCSFFGKRKCVA